jgi:adenylosuccinate synthase
MCNRLIKRFNGFFLKGDVIIAFAIAAVIIAFILYVFVSCETKVVVDKAFVEIDRMSATVSQPSSIHSTNHQNFNDTTALESNKSDVGTNNEGIEACEEFLHRLSYLKDTLLDANVITFLLSFAVGLSIALPVYLTKKIERIIKRTKYLLELAKAQPHFTRIHVVYSESALLWHILNASNHILTEEALVTIARIYREANSLLKLFRENPSIKQTESEKRRLVETIRDTIRLYDIDSLKGVPENADKMRPIELLIEHLEEIESNIDDIKPIAELVEELETW